MNDPTTHTTPPRPPQPKPMPPCPIERRGLPTSACVILCLLLTLAAATIGIGICALRTTSVVHVRIAEILSVVSLVLLTIYLWRVGRGAKGLYPILLLTAALLISTTKSAIIAGVLVALVFAVAQGSVLVAVADRRQATWIPLVPLIAYILTVAVTRDPAGAAACLLPFPAMLALAFGTRRSAASEEGPTRTGVICLTSLALGLSIAAVVALFLYRYLGSLSLTSLLDTLERARAFSVNLITSMELPETATEEMREMISPENAENMVNSVINLFPGIAVAAVLILSASVQLIQHASLKTFGYEESVCDHVRVFRMSLMSCLVFFVAYLVAIFSGDGVNSTLAGTVAQNIYIVLLPGLALAGLMRIMASLTRKGPGGMGCMFFLIILIPCLFLIAPLFLALWEVIGHTTSSIAEKIKSIKPPEDDDPFSGHSNDS